MAAIVSTGARLHFGFTNLSTAHDRLYGSLGVTLDQPRVTVRVERADTLTVSETPDCLGVYARRAVDLLGVPGARVEAAEMLPRHVGLGSGTATALATFAAIARAYGRSPAVREHAPALGRGQRSGVGVAAFETGGFVLDAGRPTAAAEVDDERGSWTVPPVTARHAVPADWRFLLVVPDVAPGRCGDEEVASIHAAIADADSTVADRIAGLVTRQVLPAVVTDDVATFGTAVTDIGRLNGSWYADEQGGVYRSPVDTIVEALLDADAVVGAGQSSWGPAAYGVTTTDRVADAVTAGERALAAADVDGSVTAVAPRNRGADCDLGGTSSIL